MEASSLLFKKKSPAEKAFESWLRARPPEFRERFEAFLDSLPREDRDGLKAYVGDGVLRKKESRIPAMSEVGWHALLHAPYRAEQFG